MSDSDKRKSSYGETRAQKKVNQAERRFFERLDIGPRRNKNKGFKLPRRK